LFFAANPLRAGWNFISAPTWFPQPVCAAALKAKGWNVIPRFGNARSKIKDKEYFRKASIDFLPATQ
jgi:hypothetical protein